MSTQSDPGQYESPKTMSSYHIDSLKDTRHRFTPRPSSSPFVFLAAFAVMAGWWLVDSFIISSLRFDRTFTEALLCQMPGYLVYYRIVVLLLVVAGAFLVHAILAQRNLKAALNKSSKWFSTTLRSLDMAIVATDRHGLIVFMNPVAQKLTGWSLEHAVGNRLTLICRLTAHGDDLSPLLDKAVFTGSAYALPDRTYLHSAQGNSPPVSGNIAPILDESGQTLGTVFAIQNMTVHRLVEESHLRLSTAVEQSPDIVIICDKDGVIRYVNPAFESFTGRTRESVTDKPVKSLASHMLDEPDRLRETLSQREVWQRKLPCINSEGKHCMLEFVVTPVRNVEGAIINIICSARDITREHDLQQELVHTQKINALGALASGVAHDFNNILTVVQNSTYIAMEYVGSEHPSHSYLETIISATDGAASLTRQLLAFSRKQVLEPELANINDLLNGMTKMLTRLVDETIEFKLQISSEKYPVVIDKGQFEHAIINMIVNARDAMSAGGVLTVKTSRVLPIALPFETREKPVDHACIEIKDTGLGIDEATKAHIFDPFFTTKPVGEGTGLGLASVYGLITQSGGNITVDSKVGKGTTFRIYLPMVIGKSLTSSQVFINSNAHLRGTETILVVEDEDNVRMTTAIALERFGYTVFAAANDKEAIALAHEEKPDLLLTDIIMPGMGGIGLSAHLHKQLPSMKILYMTGYIDYDAIARFASQPQHQLLQKPFKTQRLLEKVRAALNAPSMKPDEASVKSTAELTPPAPESVSDTTV